MTVATQAPGGGPHQRNDGGLYDILDLILDRGLVIDAFVRVSLVGIELLRIDVRVVVASVDTYLRFAEACNRLDLENKGGATLPELVGDMQEHGAQGKTKGAITGAVESITGALTKGKDEDSEESDSREPQRQPARSRRASSARAKEEES